MGSALSVKCFRPKANVLFVLGVLSCSTAWAIPGDVAGAGKDCLEAAPSSVFAPRVPTVLVVLSPRMPYALQEWERMKALAEQEGFRVEAMRDPRVPPLEWRQAVAAMGVDQLSNLEPVGDDFATRCRLLNHAPASIVGRCGVVHPWLILGVMPDSGWRETLRSRREDLSKVCE
jgi:hypothetical protein